MTSGLGCDGDSIAMTSAVNPSLEDIITGAIPGMPKVVAHTPVLAYENGAEFMQAWYDAEAGKLDPFVLILEGSVPNEKINGEGHFAGMSVNPSNGQPITTNEWIDRLAPKAAAVVALGTCATYGGIPAMKNNPTGAMGLCDYLGWGWTSAAGLPVINIPGCPVQPDNTTESLTVLVMALAGIAPVPELDDQHRLTMHFGRTVHEGCNRAAFYEHGDFATEYGSDHRCLVKLGCKGPVVKCNVPIRGWASGVGGCPNVGGICMACTMPGFPDKYMPFMDADPNSKGSTTVAKFTYGPVLRYFRNMSIRTKYDKEPPWRQPGPELTTGFTKTWNGAHTTAPRRADSLLQATHGAPVTRIATSHRIVPIDYEVGGREAHLYRVGREEYLRVELYDGYYSVGWSSALGVNAVLDRLSPLLQDLIGKAVVFDEDAHQHLRLDPRATLDRLKADPDSVSLVRLELSNLTLVWERGDLADDGHTCLSEVALIARVFDPQGCTRALHRTASALVAARANDLIERTAYVADHLERGRLAPTLVTTDG